MQVLHPRNGRDGGRRHGVIAFGQRVNDGPGKNWREWTADVAEADAIAEKLIRSGEVQDLYISQNAFHGWRRITSLSTLGAIYQDLDYQKRATHRGKKPEHVAEGVLLAIADAGIPAPSYVMSTGRGLCVVWLHELLPRNVLPRWQAVQNRLAEVLTPFGADKAALDAARVFRIAGSTNSRADPSNAGVRMVWANGSIEAPFRHTFSDLADEMLSFTRAELHSLAAERAKRKAGGKPAGTPARTLTVVTWAETLLSDLQRLRAHRYPEGAIASGERDKWLFCAATAMSWLCPAQVLERELSALAHEAAGWQGKETRSRMSSALARAHMAAAGKSMEWNGAETDPRYRMKAATVIDWLEIESSEMRDAGLRMLVDRDRSRELNTERTRASRHRRGAISREQVKADRLALGRKALYLSSSQAMNREELAAYFGVSTGQVSKAMAEARKASGT